MNNKNVNISELERLRPLGALEIYSSARHHLGFYQNVGISARYQCKNLAPENLRALVFSALAIVIEKHSILSAIPVNEDSNAPYFARVPEINLDDAVIFMTRLSPQVENGRDIELDRILEEQHNRGFKEHYGKLPFWRVIILTAPAERNSFVMSYIFHHALGDGTSGIVFHKDFLAGLSVQLSPLSSTVAIPPNQHLLPTLEQAHPSATIPTLAPYTPEDLWAGNKISLPTRTQFQSLVLSEKTSEALLQTCRAAATTLTATLPVLIATAITQSLPASVSFRELECGTPVSLRRYLSSPVNDNTMGIWIDSISHYYHREKVLEFNWEEARRSRSTITEYLKGGGREINVAKFTKVINMREYFLSKVGTERTSSFNVSNLGRLNGVPHQEGQTWEMGRMVFSRSAFVAGSAIDVGVITGPDGCIVLGFSWQEGAVSDKLVGAVVERVAERAQSLAETI